jgi:hypothetical protein
MKRGLALLVVLLVGASIALGQSKQDPTVPKWERANSPKAKSITRPHRATSPSPTVAGSAKTGTANQQLGQLEHETASIATSPPKKGPKSTVAMPKSSDAASSRHGMNYPYQSRKAMPAGPRVTSNTGK